MPLRQRIRPEDLTEHYRRIGPSFAYLIFDRYRGKRRVIAAWRKHRVWSSRVVWFR